MDYYTYHFIVNGRVAHTGITNDPRRQEMVDQARWSQGHIQVVGGPMTEQAALNWKRSIEQGKGVKPKPHSPGSQSQSLDVDIKHDQGIVTVTVAGRLDELAALTLHDKIAAYVKDAKRGLLVDMTGLTFIGSSGLRIIHYLAQQLAEGSGALILHGLSKMVREVFKISGFDQLVRIVENREAAMKMLAEESSE